MEQDKKTHHANVITGEGDKRDFVFDILKNKLGFSVKANPDFLLLESESFGVEDARDLKKWAAGKPLSGEVKASFITAKTITHEAQNALLKTLEEPPSGTYIFIHLENLGGLLPTFLSRVRVLNAEDGAKRENASTASLSPEGATREFLRSKISGRFSLINSLSREKNKSSMKNIINELERTCAENSIRGEAGPDKIKAAKKALAAKIFASARGSSPKILLDWLACMV